MYTYLADKVYLYLLAKYQDEKISYSKIGRALGLSRQTISNKIKELEKNKLIKVNDDNTFEVYNILHLDKAKVKEYLECGYSHYIIGYLLLKDLKPAWSKTKISKELGCSFQSLQNYKEELKNAEQESEKHNFIYAIIQNRRVVYVGLTNNLNEQIHKCIEKEPWLEDKDFIILEECSIANCSEREQYYIDLFNC